MATQGATLERRLPKILSARSLPGVVPQYSRRNVAWNDDGQCLLITRQAVTVATPYLMSTLTPPSVQIDSTMQDDLRRGRGGVKEEQDDDGGDEDGDADGDAPPTATGYAIARPAGGEVRWWMTTAVGKRRDEDPYNWAGLGDEVTGVITEREWLVRAAVWSPSGVPPSGCAMLVVLANTGQVSVYAPGDDPYSAAYTEIADLSMATCELLAGDEVEDGDGAVGAEEETATTRKSGRRKNAAEEEKAHHETRRQATFRGSLRMRKTALEWSALPDPRRMPGTDGSVLALGNRAGAVELWKRVQGEITLAANVQLPKPFATDVTWGPWRAVDSWTYESELAIAACDGSVTLLPVRNTADEAVSSWTLSTGTLKAVDPGDRRAITAIQWIDADTLVWTKPGSVSIWRQQWSTPKSARLERVGNWAGCNALGTAMDIRATAPDTLCVVLSSLTHHYIADISTNPRQLADESLRATLGARDVFLDCVRRRRRTFFATSDREFTANLGGYASRDGPGRIAAWMTEPVNFHNLDNATEVNRTFDFLAVDFEAEGAAAVEGVGRALKRAPSCEWSGQRRGGSSSDGRQLPGRLERSSGSTMLASSPLAVLGPHLLGLVAAVTPDQAGADALGSQVLALLNPQSVPHQGQIADQPPQSATPTDKAQALERAFWGDTSLDTLRLGRVVALWGEQTFPALASQFRSEALKYRDEIHRVLTAAVVKWAAAVAGGAAVAGPEHPGNLDSQFLANFTAGTGEAHVAAVGADRARSTVACPACSALIDSFDGADTVTCVNGHDWERCCVTHLLITTPEYRVCSVCPALSLLPAQGVQTGGELMQAALKAAIVCVKCGGRWARPV